MNYVGKNVGKLDYIIIKSVSVHEGPLHLKSEKDAQLY